MIRSGVSSRRKRRRVSLRSRVMRIKCAMNSEERWLRVRSKFVSSSYTPHILTAAHLHFFIYFSRVQFYILKNNAVEFMSPLLALLSSSQIPQNRTDRDSWQFSFLIAKCTADNKSSQISLGLVLFKVWPMDQ